MLHIELVLHDERFAGEPIEVRFVGKLRSDQESALVGMLGHDTGILCAPTAFGKLSLLLPSLLSVA